MVGAAARHGLRMLGLCSAALREARSRPTLASSLGQLYAAAAAAAEAAQAQQAASISRSLRSNLREEGPRVVKGEPRLSVSGQPGLRCCAAADIALPGKPFCWALLQGREEACRGCHC